MLMENEKDWNCVTLFMLLLIKALNLIIRYGQKLGTRNSHIVMLKNFDFRKIRHRRGHTFRKGANGLIFMLSP
jgi:hypothetical protein